MLIVSSVLSGPALQPSDVFEQPLPAGQKKIEFHISVPEVAAVVEQSGSDQPDDEGRGQCDGHNADFLTRGQMKEFLFLSYIPYFGFFFAMLVYIYYWEQYVGFVLAVFL